MSIFFWLTVLPSGDFTIGHELGPLRVNASTPSQRVALDRPVVVNVTVQSPGNVQAAAPQFAVGAAFGDGVLLAVRVDGPDAIDGPFGRLNVQNWRLEVEPLRAGEMALPTLAIVYSENKSPPVTVQFPLPTLAVVEDAASLDGELRAPPVESVESGTDRAVWGRRLRWAGIALFVGVVLAGFIMRQGRSREQRAFTALEAALSAGDNRTKLAAAHGVLLHYLKTRHGPLPPGIDNTEILALPVLAHPQNGVRRACLAEAFDALDLKRFAEREPTDADVETARMRLGFYLLSEQRGR